MFLLFVFKYCIFKLWLFLELGENGMREKEREETGVSVGVDRCNQLAKRLFTPMPFHFSATHPHYPH